MQSDILKHQHLGHSKASSRLLNISPELSLNRLIQCSIMYTTIHHTSYDYLSYMWGATLPSFGVLRNQQRCRVGQNLYDFLYMFRKSTLNTPSEHIWINAMCIVQNDELERNHQVTQLGNIFSTTHNVHV